jgi:hypothetical protein
MYSTGAVYGRGVRRDMELITILNRCLHFRGFVYHRARFSADHKTIEIQVRPRKGSPAICSFHTSWEKVFDAVEHVVTFGLAHRTLCQIDAIGVDEIQYAKGHKYLTLVYQIDLDVTRLLWVGKERTIESFQGFFTTIGDEVASKIVFVCSDM